MKNPKTPIDAPVSGITDLYRRSAWHLRHSHELVSISLMLTYRGYRAFGRFVIAPAAVLLALPACNSGGHSSTARRPSAQLTPAQAHVAFARFLPAFRSARHSHHQQAELDLVTGAELSAVQRLPGLALGPTIPALTGKRFYVPRLTGYPRWFFVTANAPA